MLIAVFMAAAVFTTSNAKASDISKSKIIELVNKSRSSEGLSPVKENDILSKAAKSKANDMIKNDYFAHTSPSGKDPWYWFSSAGYDYKFAGENLAINYDDAKEQHEAWMKSSSHRKNILNGNYTEIGVAVLEGKVDGKESTITVQLFGSPTIIVSKSPEAVPAKEEAPVAIEAPKEVLPAENAIPEIVETVENNPAVPFVEQKEVPVRTYSQNQTMMLDRWIMATIIVFSLVLLVNPLIMVFLAYKAFVYKKELEKEPQIVALVPYEDYIEILNKLDLHVKGHKTKSAGKTPP